MSEAILNNLPSCVLSVTRNYAITYANASAEAFLGESRVTLAGQMLNKFFSSATHLLELVELAFEGKTFIKEYDFLISGPRIGERAVNLQIQPLDSGEEVILVIDDRGMASKLSQHILQRDHARSAAAMASILAHEVKNPLAGIRGAAQLLGKTVSEEDRSLTQLICNEVDRIRDVIGEMEIFSNPSQIKTEAINIHEVLQYVRLLVEKSTALPVQFKEIYDPSLPEVAGNRNLLIQLFLNLIKNAVEAIAEQQSPVITIHTAYHSGLRLRHEGDAQSHPLPIFVSIEDNGPGIAADMRENIFDPFVTNKEGGKGLGLAVAAKIVADHGGSIELDDTFKSGCRFKILLPAA
jgi:two-component system nitrogen regulation sensor histidine kinase GlnL